MKRVLPVVFIWREVSIVDDDGSVSRRSVMDPLPRYSKVCQRQYAHGEEYPLAPLEARSRASHNHFHASVQDAWRNLPEGVASRWPTATHLRKWALVQEGYCDERQIVCETREHALELAAFVRSVSDYAVIVLRGNVLIIYEAKSQSASVMGKSEFEHSKRKVLDRLAAMIGSSRAELEREAGRHA